MATVLERPETTSVRTDLPLCVDLDGTLLRTDTLHEYAAAAMRDWPTLLRIPGWLVTGKAILKRNLASRIHLDASILPYNEDVIEYVREQRARGRRTILVTAADHQIATAVATHLGIFDEVIASDGRTNLRGGAKADELERRFGRNGFSYAGNDATDLKVWARAGSAVLVDTPPSIVRKVGCAVETRLHRKRSTLRAFIKAMRPHQWAKNILVFMPMLAGGAFAELDLLRAALLTFFAFCATASGIYLINDVTDLAADRQHPRKRKRPFASGDLPIKAAAIGAPMLLATGAVLGWMSGVPELIALYFVTSFSYSTWLKTRQLADVFVLSFLYTLRLFAGGEATDHRVSFWLLAFSSFLFLALAMVKRVGELISLRGSASAAHGREYSLDDAQILSIMGVAASFTATVVFALYIREQMETSLFAEPGLLWFNALLILFWQCRIWLSTSRGFMHDDPIVYSAKDWVSWLVGIGFVVIHSAAIWIEII